MLVAIHQLHYLPWLRYIHKMAQADVFIALDGIQFNKNGWQNRNKIKGPAGPLLLSVPVLHKFAQNLDQVEIDAKQPWQKKHWGTIRSHYARAPYFEEHEPFLKKIYETPWRKLNDLNDAMLAYFVRALGIQTRIVRGSDLPAAGEATERLVNLCKAVKGTEYLTGAFAAGAYLEPELFERAGIKLVTQEFQAPEYAQQYPAAGFAPEMSVLDLLLNCGPRSLEILMGTAGGDSPRFRQGLSSKAPE